ncbi:Gryzun, putative trafficking through golgi-domain-containing protein [Gongronella butleri]|nr:Gryzun, putative trafficking through golgi-domain-containing protein [Gongronella butleri]
MEAYPPEYLLHPVPVLGVYGLDGQESSAPQEIQLGDGKTGTLASTLLSIFLARQVFSLYDATRYLTSAAIPPPFRVMTIEKDYTLPDGSQKASGTHSKLSPRTPDSPLYPDGLFTPLWIQKHQSLPGTIVGFYSLWDADPTSAQPRREMGPLPVSQMIEPAERDWDAALAHEINDKRKYYQDKGIKFAVVMLMTRKQVDDPTVEERCTSIRKQSGLENKMSFFSLAPGSVHDLQEFVNMLYRTLYGAATQYYSNAIKRARKRRGRISSYAAHDPSSLALSGSDWALRYDIKMAFLHEFRQDIEATLKSLEQVYATLVDYLAPGASPILAVHGHRWAEARQLADCLNIKIYRIYLYTNDSASALAQLNGHLHMFQSYSSSWGMGEASFEYWLWLSKQYRLFAESIETAIQHGFKIRVPVPSNQSMSPPSLSGTSGGCNPGAILQHPGFYFHLAAMCCAEGRRRLLESKPQAEAQADYANMSIELLTKSYEQFKVYHNSRMTLYLAAEIAGTYYETGKYEMALKFFERIGKTYRKEHWHMILTSILRWSLRCAKELGLWERTIECLVELLAPTLPMSDAKRADSLQELLTTLEQPDNVAAKQPLVINMRHINAFIQCNFQFHDHDSFVNSAVPFQVTLQTEKTTPPSPIRFNSMRIVFNQPQYNLYLTDDGASPDTAAATASPILIDCSQGTTLITTGEFAQWHTKAADLSITKGQTKVIQGSVLPIACQDIKIECIYLDLAYPNWTVSLQYPFEQVAEEHAMARRKWLQTDAQGGTRFKFMDGRGKVQQVRIRQRPPHVDLVTHAAAPALLDEYFPLTVELTSHEDEPIDAVLYVDIKNVEDFITFHVGQQGQSSGELALGQLAPGSTLSRTIYLYGSRVAGSRLVTLMARYSSAHGQAVMEKQESIRIPFMTPFDASFRVFEVNEHSEKSSYLPSGAQHESKRLEVTIRCCSTWELAIDKLDLAQVSTDLMKQATWQTGQSFDCSFVFSLTSPSILDAPEPLHTGKLSIAWKRAAHDGPFSTTTISLPSLTPRAHGLKLLADVPEKIYMGEPITLTYLLDNHTLQVVEFSGAIELSDAFVFSGYKQFKGRLLPMTQGSYQYVCFPLSAGNVPLPRLKVLAKVQGVEKDVAVQRLGDGNMIGFDNDLNARPSLSSAGVNQSTTKDNPLLVFVNAKRA